eukprot:TRINITY_DN22116_c0_g1_i1.p1 TRINITY_DN22116_c0_g1~~TRINITY_DN22116_c0_g1_i1.p1  ORF type:complete len:186 (+),score=-13.87 TRINITY_DN22116_c0_g1_i1:478-1035(+)
MQIKNKLLHNKTTKICVKRNNPSNHTIQQFTCTLKSSILQIIKFMNCICCAPKQSHFFMHCQKTNCHTQQVQQLIIFIHLHMYVQYLLASQTTEQVKWRNLKTHFQIQSNIFSWCVRINQLQPPHTTKSFFSLSLNKTQKLYIHQLYVSKCSGLERYKNVNYKNEQNVEHLETIQKHQLSQIVST